MHKFAAIMHSPSTAILFFSRSAAAEARAKSLNKASSAHQREQLFEGLIRKTLAEISKSGLPLIKSDDTTQIGNSFGERLANAIEGVFEQGYEQVIAIGNDCPNFSHQMLQTAQVQLAAQKMVIGPAADGGAYLIGLHREIYKRQKFIDLDWETDELQKNLIDYGRELSTKIYSLSNEIDIDTEADLISFLQKFRQPGKLRTLILSLLSIADRKHTLTSSTYSSSFYTLSNLRAPPLV